MVTVKIPLFDLDDTLLRGGNKPHNDAFDFIFKKVYQINAPIKEIKSEGMIDSQIIIEILKLHNVSPTKAKEKLPQAFKEMGDYFLKHIAQGEYVLMPGVSEILTELKNRKIALGILTGNLEVIGWKKLERAGLRQFFDFGVFGNMALRRADLVPIALKKAQAKLGRGVPLKDLVIVGDSLRDVACAKESDIAIIAVATGKNTKDELKSAGADLVVSSLLDKDKIFDYLGITIIKP